jgi:3-hydroxyacyl-CoA dehydrogenase
MNLAIIGYGKMGKRIEHVAPDYGFTVALKIGRDDCAPGRFAKTSFQGIDAAVTRGQKQEAESFVQLVEEEVRKTSGR